MNKLTLLFLISLICFSCDKIFEPGSVEIEVSYYYNQYQGYKPDVGAKAFLFERDKSITSVYIDSMSSIDARIGFLVDKNDDLLDVDYKYSGEAGASGIITISDVDQGKYLLILASKGRYTFTHKYIEVNSGETLKLVKNFYYLHDYEDGGEIW